MPYPRRLTDDALARARWEYENTLTSARELSRKYRLGKSALAEWVKKQRWIKYQPPGCHEFDAGHLTERRRIRELLRDVEDGEIVRGFGASSCGYNELHDANDVLESCEAGSSRGPAIEPGHLATKQAPSLKAGQARLGADTPFETASDLAASGFSASRSTKRQHTAAPERQSKLSGCWERSLSLSPGLQVPPRPPWFG